MIRSSYFRSFLILALMAMVFAGCSRDPKVRKHVEFKEGKIR